MYNFEIKISSSGFFFRNMKESFIGTSHKRDGDGIFSSQSSKRNTSRPNISVTERDAAAAYPVLLTVLRIICSTITRIGDIRTYEKMSI